jgi:UDP-glucose 4-epimerase
MRVVVTGATGNVGTSLLAALERDDAVTEVVGLARRIPALRLAKVEWRAADVARDDLAPSFRGADVVVHLAWLIQPTRDLAALHMTNVDGSRRVFDAVRRAEVPALVYASSVGAYSPGPKDRAVDESWPTGGIRSNEYSRQKAEVERLLDTFEDAAPDVRTARLRPALIFKRESASGQRRLFAGPFLPGSLLRPGLVPFVPDVPGLVFQAVHSHDVGEAYRLAATREASGAFNIAGEPPLDLAAIARLLGARTVRTPARVLRALAAGAWHLRLVPITPSWLDMGLGVPLLDSSRARRELGWAPRYGAVQAVEDLLAGLREAAGLETPPLSPRTGGPLRMRELLSGVGRRG